MGNKCESFEVKSDIERTRAPQELVPGVIMLWRETFVINRCTG
jgi:hypothetical protein